MAFFLAKLAFIYVCKSNLIHPKWLYQKLLILMVLHLLFYEDEIASLFGLFSAFYPALLAFPDVCNLIWSIQAGFIQNH